MITEQQFMQELQSWAPGLYTLDTTMTEYEQSDTSDEYGEIFCQMTEQVLGIDSLDFDEHPVLQSAWDHMYPHKWRTLRDFYNYVSSAFIKHDLAAKKPKRKKKLVLPDLDDAATWEELINSDQKEQVTAAYMANPHIPKTIYHSVMDSRVILTVTWLESWFRKGVNSDALLLVQSPTHIDLSIHPEGRANELIEWFKKNHVT